MINQRGNLVDDGGCIDSYRCGNCGHETSGYTTVYTCPRCGKNEMLVNIAAARSGDWRKVKTPTVGEVFGTSQRRY